MLLAFDTSSAACSAALFDSDGRCTARRDELIGRGHAERLVPMIEEMLEGHSPSGILVGVGPGSFTGIRVAIAAAHGLAIGWGVELCGMSSIALLVAGAEAQDEVAAALVSGHGELFVQQFNGPALQAIDEVRSLAPQDAASAVTATLVVGSGARQLVDLRGWGEAVESFPSAENALRLPKPLRSLAPRPVYARAPDARAKEVA